MSTFTFNCLHCNSELEAQNEWSGLQLECPNCSQTITVEKKEKTITLQPIDKVAGEPVSAEAQSGEVIFMCQECGNFSKTDHNKNGKMIECPFCQEEVTVVPTELRPCPLCGETIKLKALFCKHCKQPIVPVALENNIQSCTQQAQTTTCAVQIQSTVGINALCTEQNIGDEFELILGEVLLAEGRGYFKCIPSYFRITNQRLVISYYDITHILLIIFSFLTFFIPPPPKKNSKILKKTDIVSIEQVKEIVPIGYMRRLKIMTNEGKIHLRFNSHKTVVADLITYTDNLVPPKTSFCNLLHGITKEMKIGVITGSAMGGLVIGIVIGNLYISSIGASISSTISGFGVTMNSEVLDGLAVYRIGYSKAVSLKVSKDLHDRTNKSWEKLTNSGFFNR